MTRLHHALRAAAGASAGGGEVTEDFTTYQQTGSGFTVSENTIVLDGFETRKQDAYVGKDFGSGYFNGDFSFSFYLDFSSADQWAYCYTVALSDTLDESYSIQNSGGAALGVDLYNHRDNGLYIRLREIYDTTDELVYSDQPAGKYYCNFSRSGGVAYLDIYSDEDRTTLVDSLSLSLRSTESYQYLYGLCSHNTYNSHNMWAEVGDLVRLE